MRYPNGRFGPGNPGRPPGSRNQLTFKYLDAHHETMTPEKYAKLVQTMYEMAMDSKIRPLDRYHAALWLQKPILPADSPTFAQIFAPQLSIENRRNHLDELKALKAEYKELLREPETPKLSAPGNGTDNEIIDRLRREESPEDDRQRIKREHE